jgi:hypothetical protein
MGVIGKINGTSPLQTKRYLNRLAHTHDMIELSYLTKYVVMILNDHARRWELCSPKILPTVMPDTAKGGSFELKKIAGMPSITE